MKYNGLGGIVGVQPYFSKDGHSNMFTCTLCPVTNYLPFTVEPRTHEFSRISFFSHPLGK